MLLLDVLIRYPTITLLFAMAFLLWRYARNLIQGKLGILVSLSMAVLLLGTAPPPLKLPEPAYTFVRITDISNLAMLWLFSLSLFRDDFKMGKVEWAGLIIYTSVVGTIRLFDLQVIETLPQAFFNFASLFSAALMIHLIWTALQGRKDDLVESRRKGRVWFALGMTVAAGISIFSEFAVTDMATVDFIRPMTTLPIIVWAFVWLTEFRTDKLMFQPETRTEPTEPAKPAINPKDKVMHDQLVTIMEEDEIYKEQGLTIRILSDRMSVPEHQLRSLINQGLGYRNFAAFLNHYRLGYAKSVLSDPAQARLPVLTIAMDAGFNSLAPFNRAFKATEGVTPTAYRAGELGG